MNKLMTVAKHIRDLNKRMKRIRSKRMASYKEIAQKAGGTEPWLEKFRYIKDPNSESHNIDKLERAVLYFESMQRCKSPDSGLNPTNMES